jgi:hypothetical protein
LVFFFLPPLPPPAPPPVFLLAPAACDCSFIVMSVVWKGVGG